MSDKKVIETLKLQKKITENFTVMAEDNKVLSYDTEDQIMFRYLQVKLLYTEKRRQHQIKMITENIKLDISRYVFIKAVMDQELVINNRDIPEIYEDIEQYDKIIKQDQGSGGYDYLLMMSIKSVTKKRVDQLMDKLRQQKDELDKLKSTNAIKIYREELQSLEV